MDLCLEQDPGHPSILHVLPSIGRRSGGLGPIAVNLAREQRRLGCCASVWCLDSPAAACESARESGLEERAAVTFPVSGPASIGFSPRMERAVASQQGEVYTILHQHGIWMANSRVTNRWRGALERATVVAPQGSLEDYALRRSQWKKRLATLAYEGRNLKAASCLHATSPAEVASFRRYGLTNPIAMIPNGIPDAWLDSVGDPERFLNRFSIPADRRVLLFLSRIHPKKGLPLLFRAIAELRHRLDGWLLAIAGPDERGHLLELRSLAEKLNIEDLVQFIGPLFGTDKRDAYAVADVVVLPTHSENFGIVVAEALGAGVPVLTTHGAPWEELEIHGCGWWVDIDVAAMRNALLDAVQRSPTDLRVMGQRGRSLVARQYLWSRIAQQTILLYNWLLGHSEQPDFVIRD
jgi:glycosyltransferase involved in cell wall biosynthesis